MLDNPPALRGGEDLVSFYMTPAYHMWDPSKAVLFAFALFFAMIIADAGYGVLLGVILWAMWKRLGATASGRGLRGVMLTLVIFSIVYGVLLGSYFGVEPPQGSWLAALHILDANDQGMMMWLVDRRRRGAPRRCQPGHRLAAPACPARAQWPGVGRHHPGRLLRRGGEKLSR